MTDLGQFLLRFVNLDKSLHLSEYVAIETKVQEKEVNCPREEKAQGTCGGLKRAKQMKLSMFG